MRNFRQAYFEDGDATTEIAKALILRVCVVAGCRCGARVSICRCRKLAPSPHLVVVHEDGCPHPGAQLIEASAPGLPGSGDEERRG